MPVRGARKRSARPEMDAFESSATAEWEEFGQRLEPAVRRALQSPGTKIATPAKPAFAEAWIAYAMCLGRGRVMDMGVLVGNADALNHAIPIESEVVYAFGRLQSRGWLVVTPTEFGLSKEARRIVRKIVGRKRWFEAVERLERWVAANPP